MVIVIVSVGWGRWPSGDRRECQLVTCWLWVAGCGLGAAACGSGSRLSPVLARQPTSCTTANSWPSSTAANSGATTPMPCACASDATKCDFEPIACTGSTQRE